MTVLIITGKEILFIILEHKQDGLNSLSNT